MTLILLIESYCHQLKCMQRDTSESPRPPPAKTNTPRASLNWLFIRTIISSTQRLQTLQWQFPRLLSDLTEHFYSSFISTTINLKVHVTPQNSHKRKAFHARIYIQPHLSLGLEIGLDWPHNHRQLTLIPQRLHQPPDRSTRQIIICLPRRHIHQATCFLWWLMITW